MVAIARLVVVVVVAVSVNVCPGYLFYHAADADAEIIDNLGAGTYFEKRHFLMSLFFCREFYFFHI